MVEPGGHAIDYVAPVFGLEEFMAFAGFGGGVSQDAPAPQWEPSPEQIARMRADTDVRVGQSHVFAFNLDKAVLFDPATTRRI